MMTPFVSAPRRTLARRTFLLHCNGTDGSTSFVDEIGGLTGTVSGNAQVDTGQSQFGGASAQFDGSGDLLSFALTSAINLSAEFQFTLQLWVRVDATVSANGVILTFASGTGLYPCQFWYEHSTGKLGIRGFTTDSSAWGWQTAAAVTKGQWYHMLLMRQGQRVRGAVDGAIIGTASVSNGLPLFASTSLSIGANSNLTAPFKGWIDEIAIDNGWSTLGAGGGAFTPPTAEFTDHG